MYIVTLIFISVISAIAYILLYTVGLIIPASIIFPLALSIFYIRFTIKRFNGLDSKKFESASYTQSHFDLPVLISAVLLFVIPSAALTYAVLFGDFFSINTKIDSNLESLDALSREHFFDLIFSYEAKAYFHDAFSKQASTILFISSLFCAAVSGIASLVLLPRIATVWGRCSKNRNTLILWIAAIFIFAIVGFVSDFYVDVISDMALSRRGDNLVYSPKKYFANLLILCSLPLHIYIVGIMSGYILAIKRKLNGDIS